MVGLWIQLYGTLSTLLLRQEKITNLSNFIDMKTINDKRVLKAILRKICKENDIDINNVYISKFGYVQTVDFNKKDADFCSTIYKGVEYKVKYFDGYFYPFIVPVEF